MLTKEEANVKIAEMRARATEAKTSRIKLKEVASARRSAEKVLAAGKKMPAYLKKEYGKAVVAGGYKLARNLVNPSIMSEEQFMGTASSRGSSQPGRGRGRPTGTYTYQIPGVGPVPIQAYKRWISQQKAMQRVQAELAKARMSIQPSPQEMPQGYGYPDAEDAFLNTEDQSALQQMQMAQMQQAQQQVNMPQQQSRFNVANIFRRPQQMPGSDIQFAQRPPMSPGAGPSVQRLQIWGEPSQTDPRNNILNAPNVFNRQGEASIGVARRQQFY